MPSSVGDSNDFNVYSLPKIAVFGIGGAGVNAVNNIVFSQIDFENVKCVVANTDDKSLINSPVDIKIQLGKECTRGLGAGADPEKGKQAAEESIERIKKELYNVDMLFITCGMGGGTGTGASPVIAKIAKEMDILTVAIVVKPFKFERRDKQAQKGIEELEKIVDNLIIVDNEKLSKLNNQSMTENYRIADSVLCQIVCCIVDITAKTGYINCDFADVKTILSSMGRAFIGTGEDIDPKIATDQAIHNQILENSSIYGAKNILLNITSSKDVKVSDYEEIISKIEEESKINDEDEPKIIFGTVIDDSLGNNIRVSVLASGLAKTQQEEINKQQEKIQIEGKQEDIDVKEELNEKVEVNKVEAPEFTKPIDEDDLENDDSFNLNTEEIPTTNDNTISFKNTFFEIAEEKKKINKNTINYEKKKQTKNDNSKNLDKTQNGQDLFSSQETKKGKGILAKIINSIGPSTYIENELNDQSFENEEEVEDIYNTPAIKRKAV